MTRSRFCVASVVLVALACTLACSSKSSDNAAAAPTTPRPDSGSCTTQCCELPTPGTSCAGTDAGVTCGYAVTCQEGLVLNRTTSCERDGLWRSINDCPSPGAADERGCPSAQPADKSPCTVLPDQGTPSCGYSKTCEAKLCDASDCVPVHQSATAICVNGLWQSIPLGPC